MKRRPPRWADRFLEWYCRADLLEEIQGDAYELFNRRAQASARWARVFFIWDVFRFCRWQNIKKKRFSHSAPLTSTAMIKNILTVAFRNFLRQPGHSALSVFGLTVGFISSFLLLLWVAHEFSYDRFHHEPQRIFKVMSHVETNGTLETFDAAALNINVGAIPEVEHHVTIIDGTRWPNELCFKPGKSDNCIYMNGIYAQPSLFTVFNFPVIKGVPDTPGKKYIIAISKRMAGTLFQGQDPVGKMLNIDNWFDVEITAVFDNPPPNSSIRFDFVMPLPVFQKLRGLSDDAFNESFMPTYVKTRDDVSAEYLSAKFATSPVRTERLKKDKVSYSAFPLTDWRLNGEFENGKSVGGRITYVWIFIIIALLIVGMALINYINLNTARAVQRAKEIGIRKVTGAIRSSIIFQFVGESFLVVAGAFALAILGSLLLLPYFNSLVGEQIVLHLGSGWLPVFLVVFLFLAAAGAGLYPAFQMSSYQPAAVLKGQITSTHSGSFSFRKTLLVLQLSTSLGIVLFSGVLFNQLQYIFKKDLGYDRGNMVRIEPTYELLKKYDAFKNELLTHPAVKGVAASDSNPLNIQGHTTGISWPGKPADQRVTFQTMGCNNDFVDVFGIEIVKGRNFLTAPADSVNTEILLSKSAVEVMGLDEPVGVLIQFGDARCKVVGVVEDFHTESLHEMQLPVILYSHPLLNCSAIYVRYESGNPTEAILAIESIYKKFEPAWTMRFWFQDETFDNLYKTEKTAFYLAMLFTIIALVIAVIGVIGLATYNVIRKRKEISIKRVFGARIVQVLAMLTKEFAGITLIACLIALPLAWFVASQWLSGFAYHTQMPWWLFVSASAGLFILTTILICVQGLKAVLTNPTKILRSE